MDIFLSTQQMSSFDSYINSKLQASQFAVGISTVLFSILSKSVIPKLPHQVYRILDVTVVRIVILAFLIVVQTKQPTLSVAAATVIVLVLKYVTSHVVDVPPLSEILKPEQGKDKNDKPSPVVCNCAPQIVVPNRYR